MKTFFAAAALAACLPVATQAADRPDPEPKAAAKVEKCCCEEMMGQKGHHPANMQGHDMSGHHGHDMGAHPQHQPG